MHSQSLHCEQHRKRTLRPRANETLFTNMQPSSCPVPRYLGSLYFRESCGPACARVAFELRCPLGEHECLRSNARTHAQFIWVRLAVIMWCHLKAVSPEGLQLGPYACWSLRTTRRHEAVPGRTGAGAGTAAPAGCCAAAPLDGALFRVCSTTGTRRRPTCRRLLK